MCNHRRVEARIDNLLAMLTLLYHTNQDGIHNLIRRQYIAILMVGAQLRRRLLREDALRNYLPELAIDISSQLIHLGLIEVTRNAECTCRIAIERTEAERILALVR